MDEALLKLAESYDEVWHAGDWGDMALADQLQPKITVRGVYGNIDNHIIRKCFPKELYFECEGLQVYMTHIGGYPGRYQSEVKSRLKTLKPQLYICGHSHILKIMRDNELGLFHFNPGAMGLKGFHSKRTYISFGIDNGKIVDVKVHEYEKVFKDQL